jgi:peptidoglycan hydrolase CwlO-like protein
MNENQRIYRTTSILPTTTTTTHPTTTNTNGNVSNSTLGNFEYKPPNNTGIILGIIGGALTIVGDALGYIGAIIQLNIDVNADFQSQVDAFKSGQEKDKMQEEIDELKGQVKEIDDLKGQVKEIDDLKEQMKQLEKIIKGNQN